MAKTGGKSGGSKSSSGKSGGFGSGKSDRNGNVSFSHNARTASPQMDIGLAPLPAGATTIDPRREAWGMLGNMLEAPSTYVQDWMNNPSSMAMQTLRDLHEQGPTGAYGRYMRAPGGSLDSLLSAAEVVGWAAPVLSSPRAWNAGKNAVGAILADEGGFFVPPAQGSRGPQGVLQAAGMRRSGAAPGEIFSETGLWRNPSDTGWVAEMDTSAMRMNPNGRTTQWGGRLGDIVEHPVIDAAPRLRGINANVDFRGPKIGGYESNPARMSNLSRYGAPGYHQGEYLTASAPNDMAGRSVLAQQMQQVIDQQPGMLGSSYADEVARRANMNQLQRSMNPPSWIGSY